VETVQLQHHICEADIAAWHRVVSASTAYDLPGESLPTLEQITGELAVTNLTGRRLNWIARDTAGVVVGVAGLRLFTGAGRDHLAEFAVHVHPGHRSRGTGGRLLAAVISAAVADGRRSLVVEASSTTPAVSFLEQRGFGCVLSLSVLLLVVAEMSDRRLADLVAADHPGYRLTRWRGTVPDELAQAFTDARAAMDDVPVGEPDFTSVGWDIDRVKEMAEVVHKRGDTLITVAAMAGDRVAGFTEIVIPHGDVLRVYQYDTAVVPEHRGNGLGLWVKAAMLEWLRAEWPDVAEIETDNAEDNAHMLNVNERLGFRHLRQTRQYQLDLQLAARA
jgi:GNAT superfamily N-acetyltransferase